MNICRAPKCKRPIPARLHFCYRCSKQLRPETRHAVLCSPTDEVLARADEEFEQRPAMPSIYPATPSIERFRNARELSAKALKILGGK